MYVHVHVCMYRLLAFPINLTYIHTNIPTCWQGRANDFFPEIQHTHIHASYVHASRYAQGRANNISPQIIHTYIHTGRLCIPRVDQMTFPPKSSSCYQTLAVHVSMICFLHMYMTMYVCIFVCMYVYLYVCMYICMYVCIKQLSKRGPFM